MMSLLAAVFVLLLSTQCLPLASATFTVVFYLDSGCTSSVYDWTLAVPTPVANPASTCLDVNEDTPTEFSITRHSAASYDFGITGWPQYSLNTACSTTAGYATDFIIRGTDVQSGVCSAYVINTATDGSGVWYSDFDFDQLDMPYGDSSSGSSSSSKTGIIVGCVIGGIVLLTLALLAVLLCRRYRNKQPSIPAPYPAPLPLGTEMHRYAPQFPPQPSPQHFPDANAGYSSQHSSIAITEQYPSRDVSLNQQHGGAPAPPAYYAEANPQPQHYAPQPAQYGGMVAASSLVPSVPPRRSPADVSEFKQSSSDRVGALVKPGKPALNQQQKGAVYEGEGHAQSPW